MRPGWSPSRGTAVGTGLVLALLVWWSISSGDKREKADPQPPTAEVVGSDEDDATVVDGYVIDRSTGVSIAEATAALECTVEDVADGGGKGTKVLKFTQKVDGDGGFLFEQPPAEAECVVTAKAEGYVADTADGGGDGQSRAAVTIRDGIAVHGVELSLFREARVQGTVLVGDRGLADCVFTVLYLEAPGRDEPFTVDVETVSGKAGRFDIAGLAPGRVQVLAEHGDHAMAESESFFLKAGETKTDLTIRLAAGGSIAASVTDAQGQPIEGARVALYAAAADTAGQGRPRGKAGKPLRSGTTDDKGTLAFEGVATGELRITASALGFRRATVTASVVAGEAATVTLTLERQDGIGGRVVDEDGRAVAGASVYSTDPESRGRIAARSNARGQFWISWRPAAGSRLYASHSKYATSGRVAVPTDGGEVTLQLRPGGRLRARVLDPTGRPVAVYSAAVWPEPGTRGRGQNLRVGDSSGVMEVTSLAPGTYTIRISAAGFPPAVTRPIKVEAQELTDAGDIKLVGGGQLSGRVIDSATHKPVANARVFLSGARAAGYRGRTPTASTGVGGEFLIRGLPAGRLSLRFVRRGYVTRVESGLIVTANEVVDLGDIEVTRVTGDTAGRGRMQYQGVGAVLQRRGDGLLVQRVFDGAPAAAAGLTAGTKIQTINGTAVGELDLRRAVELIRGEAGSDVTLEVVLPGKSAPETVRIVRGEVMTPKAKPRHGKKR